MVGDVKGAISVFITPHFRAGGSHNKTRWVKYLCEINSCDKAVTRDRKGAGIKSCRGRQKRGERKEERWQKRGQTSRRKPTWLPASGMSAVSRLVTIHYPSLLKYYALWLMLTAWPEGGDCVDKCVCLHLGRAASKRRFYSEKSRK